MENPTSDNRAVQASEQHSATILGKSDIEMTSTALRPHKLDGPYLVDFSEPFDSDNPKDWPASKKWTVTDVLSASGFNRIMVSTIMAPAIPTIAKELNMSSAESAMALSIYLLATAFGPLVMGPLSEIYGRKPILHASNIWFFVWNIICGFSRNKETLIAARFFAGFGASAIYALAGGVLGDIWRPEQRGTTLGVYLLIPLLGAAVGPIIGGFVAQRTTWRWMFWSTSAFQAVMIVASFLAFSETYPPLILRRRAAKRRSETGDPRYFAVVELREEPGEALQMLSQNLVRPLRLLISHPIVQVQALLCGFSYGLLYILLSTFATLWIDKYHERLDISGLHYIAIAIGEIGASQIVGFLMDRCYIRLKRQANADGIPEFHLPMMVPGWILATVGFFVYGWTAQSHAHWAIVDFGILVATFGLQMTSSPMQAYLIDCYPEHASSAMAARQFVSSMTAFGFPLFAPSLYSTLNYGWANSLLGFLTLLMGVPAFLLLWYRGARLRARSQESY